jgi:hypothetical protein
LVEKRHVYCWITYYLNVFYSNHWLKQHWKVKEAIHIKLIPAWTATMLGSVLYLLTYSAIGDHWQRLNLTTYFGTKLKKHCSDGK